jgi:hypothetical protein
MDFEEVLILDWTLENEVQTFPSFFKVRPGFGKLGFLGRCQPVGRQGFWGLPI